MVIQVVVVGIKISKIQIVPLCIVPAGPVHQPVTVVDDDIIQ